MFKESAAKKLQQLIGGVLITTVGTSAAWAQNTDIVDRGHLAKAKVIDVEPITRTLTHRIPQETCWTERVRYRDHSHHSAAPALIGGIIGAAVGNGLGQKRHKSNRAIKAVALGALGASIGHQIARNSHDGGYRYKDEQRCEVSYETSYEERIVGYDVTYRYRGETYQTRMDYDPGDNIRVRVNVRPVM